MYLALISPLFVVIIKSVSVFLISSTLVKNLNSTPLSQAFSARAIVSPNGQTIPPVGTSKAATTSSVTSGSILLTSSPSIILSSSTPFFLPLSSSSVSLYLSASSKQSIKEPLFSNSKSSSLASSGIILLPSTLNLALLEPGLASYPACTIPLFALEVPEQTSSSFSSTATDSSYLESSRATAEPTTPAPITTTSYLPIIFSISFSFLKSVCLHTLRARAVP